MLAMLGGCQKNEPYYVENPNWHVFYEGRIWDPEYHDYTDLIVVNGPTSRENYLVGWATVEEFNRMGSASLPGRMPCPRPLHPES